MPRVHVPQRSILPSQQSRGHAGAPLIAQHPFPAAGHSASYQGGQLPLSFKAPEPLQVKHTLTNRSWVSSARMLLKDNLKDITVNLRTWDREERKHTRALPAPDLNAAQDRWVLSAAVPSPPHHHQQQSLQQPLTHTPSEPGAAVPTPACPEDTKHLNICCRKRQPKKSRPLCQALLGDSLGGV